MYTFSLYPPSEIDEEEPAPAVTNLEICNSVFENIERNKIFTIYTPRHWEDPGNILND